MGLISTSLLYLRRKFFQTVILVLMVGIIVVGEIIGHADVVRMVRDQLRATAVRVSELGLRAVRVGIRGDCHANRNFGGGDIVACGIGGGVLY